MIENREQKGCTCTCYRRNFSQKTVNEFKILAVLISVVMTWYSIGMFRLINRLLKVDLIILIRSMYQLLSRK